MDDLYASAVTREIFKELPWQKTPGIHQVKAIMPIEDSSFVETAMMAIGRAAKDNAVELPNGNQIMLDYGRENSIIVMGKEYISILVNVFGVDFNGSAAYRILSKNP